MKTLKIDPARAQVALIGNKLETWYEFRHMGILAQGWIGQSVDSPCHELRVRISDDEVRKHELSETALRESLPGIVTQFITMVRKQYGAK